MKILVLNYEYPPIGGGAGNISRHISNQLALKGHTVLVVTTWFEGLAEHENETGKPEIIRLRSKRKHMHQSNPFEMYSWIKTTKEYLFHYLEDKKFDICLANFSMIGGSVALHLKKKFNLPYIVLSHGHDIPWYYKQQMFFYHLLTYFRIKHICKESAVNFVQTEFMKNNIDRFTGKKLKDKNIIIPNGSEINLNSNNNQRNNEPFTILFVGRFVKQKDPITLLMALRKTSRMDIPFRLILIGDGPMRKKMEEFVKKNEIPETTFTGWIPQEKVKEYYQKAHVIITPSLAEGMSIANLEALAFGVYLIATPVSGNAEMLSCCKNGVLVEPGNYIEIANQLQKFYFEQYLPKNFNAQNYASLFSEKYSWTSIAEKYEKEFLKIVN